MNLTHRFPKWLLTERYEIVYAPNLAAPFMVVLFSKTSARFIGCGASIGKAAKEAQKRREEAKR